MLTHHKAQVTAVQKPTSPLDEKEISSTPQQMPLKSNLHLHHFIKHFCATPTSSSSWRNQAQQRQIISQISTILLQRHNWPSLLTPLNLSPKLTPSFFLQTLHKIQSNPQISLVFFNWAKSNHGFQPDLRTHCKIVQVIAGSDDTRPIKPILDSFIGVDPPANVLNCMNQACKGTNLQSVVFSLVIECYAQKGLYFDSLFMYRKVTSFDCIPRISSLNKVLDVLDQTGEFALAYCLYGSLFRNGILPNKSTWSIIARVLCKAGKFESVVRVLELGVSNSVVFGLVIEWYGRIGEFGAAIDQVNEMYRRNLEPGFGIYGSILDGACRVGDSSAIETIVDAMRDKKLLPENLSREYDAVVKKFCDLGKTYAAEFLFKRAREDGVGLNDATFGYMLRAFSNGGRTKESIWLYHIILNEKILVKKSYYQELADSICKLNPSDEAYQLLVDLIKRGVTVSVSEISMFMVRLGRMNKWKEAEDLLNVMLQAGLLPNSGCCRSLVEHYCNSDQTDSVLLLHDKLEGSEMSWDVKTYNVLLRALITEKRVDAALRVFDCMRKKEMVSTASFLVMISGLSQENEMRKAMQVHDEMLKMGLKPSSKTYKNLISVFR